MRLVALDEDGAEEAELEEVVLRLQGIVSDLSLPPVYCPGSR